MTKKQSLNELEKTRQGTIKKRKSKTLRKQAERELKSQTEGLQEQSTRDIPILVHELQVHQIELEMQNEELRRIQSELEESRNRYFNLYDFAPVSYFTFDKNGMVMEVNLTGAKMLGIERSRLIKKPFSLYINFSNRDVFYLHLRKVFGTNTRQTCEIKLMDRSGNQLNARLESMAVHDAVGNFSQCRTAIIDVTEHKKAEEAIRESEERYRGLIESANDIIAMVSPDGIIISLNPAFERITGWACKEWIGKRFLPLIHPDDLPNALEDFQHTMSGKMVPSSQLRLFTNNGGYKDVEYVTTPLLRDGEVIGNLNVVRDITERKRTEEAMRAQRQRFNDILDMLPAYLVLLSPDHHILFANRFFREHFGESHGRRCFEHLFKRSEPCEICETHTVLKTNAPHHWEWIGPDSHNYDIFDFPFTDTDGSTLIMEIGIDITERKRAEEKIREQATLLDRAHDAVGVRNMEHNLIYWNKGAEYLYGWTAEEVIGKNADELLYKEQPSGLIEAKKSVIEKGEWMGELGQITKEGKKIIVESRWTLMYDSKGKPKSILIINTDITEKKKFESQLLRSQRMEGIGTLAGGIAHDLNNVLTPIMLSLQMLKEKFEDEQSQRLLTILEQNSQRGANLIKQVMSFARGIEGERKPLQVKYIITEIEKIAKETFPRDIKLQTDMPNDLWTVSGDATQLHQVIMNLCVNARDAMPDGGVLSIIASNFFIDENYTRMHTEAKAGSYIVITISDTGTDIPSEIIDRIFEPFFTTKEFGKGTGLGLSTSLAIVKSHGGFINVYSEVGKGTAFRIYLPAIKTEIHEIREQQLELLVGKGEWVLVAEDEESIRDVTLSTLETCGYKVLTANDGAEAVALYAENIDKIKVILMDMMMPVMDGQASIRAIRIANSDVKIIAVSGLTEKDRLAKVADLANAFLPKPYTTEKLLKAIHEVLSAK